MFAPSAELVKKYSEETISANDPQDRRIQELIYDYILRNLSPDPKTGRRRPTPVPPNSCARRSSGSRMIASCNPTAPASAKLFAPHPAL